ncbi:hypothetical protein JCM11251_000176 [Rhodosporidiobolus azoricus]
MAHHLESHDWRAAEGGSHRMHKRQRVATTAADDAGGTTTTRRRATTTTRAARPTTARVAATVVDQAVTSSSFRPGAAATGTATRSVGDTPPTRSRELNTVDSSAYSVSFASQQTGYTASQKAATTGAAEPVTATDAGLPQGALIGIIAGAAGGGVLLLAIIGFCCWQRKKAKKEEKEEKKWVGLSGTRAGGGGGKAEPKVSIGHLDPWASTDSFAGKGGYPAGTEKGWAGESSVSLATLAQDEKSAAYSGGGSAAQNLDSARAELFALRQGPPARSMTPLSMASAAPVGRQRVETGTFSVNDVISFSGAPGGDSQYPPASSIYPPSSGPGGVPQSASHPSLAPSAHYPSPPPQPLYPPSPPPQQHQPRPYVFNPIPVAPSPQPISTPDYPPARPARPSEVPSAPPSPFNRGALSKRDTQLEKRDEDLESRFFAVMTGAVGRDEDSEVVVEEKMEETRRKRQSIAPLAAASERRKKDTIVGLADAYAGGGEDQWGEIDLDAPSQSRPPRTDSAPRTNIPQRTTSKRKAALPAPVSTISPEVEAFPLPPRSDSSRPARPPAATHSNRYSTRIDSKPLRELEGFLEKMPPIAGGGRPFPRISESSDISSSFSARRQSRMSVASSVAPLNLPRRPAGAVVPNSGSKDSLSPMTAASGAAHSPYGEPKRYEHSIYSAAGEMGEMSSASGSTTSSPSKMRRPGMSAGISPSSSLSPLGTPLSERGPVLGMSPSALAMEISPGEEDEDDIFYSAVPTSSTPPPRTVSRPAPAAVTSTRLPPPAPLRLARNASLANRQPSPLPSQTAPHIPSHPLASSSSYSSPSPLSRNPLTMSAAERDVLNQLGLPSPSVLSVSTATYDSGERTPDLTRSASSSAMGMPSPLSSPDTSILDTPQTPHFAFGQPFGVAFHEPSYLDVLSSSRSPSPSPSPTPNKSAPTAMQTKHQQQHLDPLAAGGWESLASMAAANQDPNYRSATMSIYGMYD